MTLAEKILELRTARNLSQGDLAERLEVSRQSVSKWETGQSVPDLDKIIKLADLFEVSVDELVREDAKPHPDPEPTNPGPQVIWFERRRPMTAAKSVGIGLCTGGGLCVVLGLLAAPGLALIGLGLLLLALPLLLAKRHPWLICGWVIAGLGYAVFNPYVTATPRSLAAAAHHIALALLYPEHDLLRGGPGIGTVIALVRGMLTLLLLVLTIRAWRKRNR